MRALIPILYTIREADGIYKLKRFLESVKDTNLESFELIFIAKSDTTSFARNIEKVVNSFDLDFSWKIWSTSDDGFYFSSYRRFLLEYNCKYTILLSSDSVVTHKNWAEILILPIESNLAPICGSMGSWESILENANTIGFISMKKRLKCALSTSEAALDYYYNGELSYSPQFKHAGSLVLSNIVIRLFSMVIFLKHFRTYITLKTAFFRFPNPHIRGTGFAITRDLFLMTMRHDTQNEMDGFKIESGKKSFSNMQESNNFKTKAVIWVGGGYVQLFDESVQSTFRSESNFVPLVIDDHYLDFKNSNASRRKSLGYITWGMQSR
jgi:hypothetical protein